MEEVVSLFLVGLFLLFQACNKQEKERSFTIDYEKITLSSGLNVVLHQDRSDPIAAVSVLYHVGSSREEPGKTGFAHFFEHMMFQRSENVPEGYFWTKIPEWGGSANGLTTKDHTLYFEVFPKDALEKILWMESDRMGFLVNSVTKASLEGEKPVLMNEKRQRMDNAPYGFTSRVINQALYPPDHPYNWSVLGEMEDLQNATLNDVKEFYERYYGPNNATLVISGDFDRDKTKKMVQKYFGEIPPRGVDTAPEPIPVELDSTISLYHEDTFAKVPELRLTWPTVHQFHQDKWALDILGRLLSDGQGTPLYEIIVKQNKQAPNTSAFHRARELAGSFTIRVRANADTDLDSVKASVIKALQRFEENGVNPKKLDKIKVRLETLFYKNLSSVLFKSFRLAYFTEYTGSPDFLAKEIHNIRDVSSEDVMRVYKKYISDKNHVITSFIPQNKLNLTVANSIKAPVKEEKILADVEISESGEVKRSDDYPRTPSSFDRTKEPPFDEKPTVEFPDIWNDKLTNGIGVYSIEANEVPLVYFSIRIKGGHMAEDPEKAGTAYLLADLLMESTKNKTPEELENAIGRLGAEITIDASREYITLSVTCLSRNYKETVALVREILLEPRWDENKFERIKKAAVNNIQQRNGDASALASVLIYKKLYGRDHILGSPVSGTIESMASISLEDLKTFYHTFFSPSVADFHVVGDISEVEALRSLKDIEEQWVVKEVTLPEIKMPEIPKQPMVYFKDLPNARQSEIRIGGLTISGSHEDYYPLTVAGYRLGGMSGGTGLEASILFQVLREEKGYTYGAYSQLERNTVKSPFIARASVKSNKTDKALEKFKELIADYGENYTKDDLQITKSSLIRANALTFETLPNLLNVLQTISTYNLPLDYIERQQQMLQNMSLDEVKALIEKYLDSSKMVYVVVGDKATQFEKLKSLGGFGELIEVELLNAIKTGKSPWIP